jgi:hypothetical protein
MAIDFASIAPYLKDPLVLVGFFLFLGFLFTRKILAVGIIPPVGPGRGAQIIRLILHYGFVIGALLIILGFGLKYRELSNGEQQRAVNLLLSELKHNLYVADELAKNTETLTNAANIVAGSLRIEKLKINYVLFPSSNIDAKAEQDPDLYNKVYDRVLNDDLLNNKIEMRRFLEQCAAISRTIDKTSSTIESLADRNGSRYVIQNAAYSANLPILRKITIVSLTDISSLYAKTEEERQKYFRVADSVSEYTKAVRSFCSEPLPNKSLLSSVLATERLSVQLLNEHRKNLLRLSEIIANQSTALEQVKIAAAI